MAFKMKGFPLRSSFAHADTKHSDGDHQHMEQKSEEQDAANVQLTPKEKAYYISELESYYGIEFDENNPRHQSLLRSFKKPQPGN